LVSGWLKLMLTFILEWNCWLWNSHFKRLKGKKFKSLNFTRIMYISLLKLSLLSTFKFSLLFFSTWGDSEHVPTTCKRRSLFEDIKVCSFFFAMLHTQAAKVLIRAMSDHQDSLSIAFCMNEEECNRTPDITAKFLANIKCIYGSWWPLFYEKV
jgi:hypothetical protein